MPPLPLPLPPAPAPAPAPAPTATPVAMACACSAGVRSPPAGEGAAGEDAAAVVAGLSSCASNFSMSASSLALPPSALMWASASALSCSRTLRVYSNAPCEQTRRREANKPTHKQNKMEQEMSPATQHAQHSLRVHGTTQPPAEQRTDSRRYARAYNFLSTSDVRCFRMLSKRWSPGFPWMA